MHNDMSWPKLMSDTVGIHLKMHTCISTAETKEIPYIPNIKSVQAWIEILRFCLDLLMPTEFKWPFDLHQTQ